MFKNGENNPRWNDGNSEYPNHAEFKRMRIKVLQRSKGKCEICGDIATIVHHIDGDKSNHNLDNLIPVCRKCHMALHAEDGGSSDGRGESKNRGRPTAKYTNLYGMTIKKIAAKFGVTQSAVYSWVNNPKKKKWLEEKLKEEN